jgi:branched-chain amino acid transport system substrate-binding protein
MNKAFVGSFTRQYGYRPNFMVVSGYDGMHLIYEALRRTSGATDAGALMSAMRGMAWESPRGPMAIDHGTGDVIQNIYIRKVERANDELHNVEFATFQAVKNHHADGR